MDEEKSIKDIFDFDKDYDKFKTKVLRYVLYKKRTEAEVRDKFKDYDGLKENYLDDVIYFLRENKYICEEEYIDRTFREYIALKAYSIKQIIYKLLAKGITQEDIDKYISKYNMQEKLKEYEINSAVKLLLKREDNDPDVNIKYLLSKGFEYDNIKEAIDRL